MNHFYKRISLVLTVFLFSAQSIFSQVLQKYDIFDDYNNRVFGYQTESYNDSRLIKNNKIKEFMFGKNPYIITGKTGSHSFQYAKKYEVGGKTYYNILKSLKDVTTSDNDYYYFNYDNSNNPCEIKCEVADYATYYAHQEFDSKNRMTHLKVEKESKNTKENYIEVWVTYQENGKVSVYTGSDGQTTKVNEYYISVYEDSDGQIYKFDENENPVYIKYSENNEEWITYNKKGLEETKKYSDGTSYTNIYDKKSHCVKRVWNDGVENIFEYNKDGNIIHKYTTFPGVDDKLVEVNYEYHSTDRYEDYYSEKHSDGDTFCCHDYKSFDGKSKYTASKMKQVESIIPEESVIYYLPDNLFKDDDFNSYISFYDVGSIYLIPHGDVNDGYVYTSGGILTKTTLAADTTHMKLKTHMNSENHKEGDFIFFDGKVYYQNFNKIIDFYSLYDAVSEDFEDDDTRNLFLYQALSGEWYVVPNGIIMVHEGSSKPCIFGIEFNGMEVVRLICEEDLPEWLNTQNGNFSFSKSINNGYVEYRIYKNGMSYRGPDPFSRPNYQQGTNVYAGSINNQFDIYHFDSNTYCIVSKSGNLEGYIEFPEDKGCVSKNYVFDDKGAMYGVISPEYTREFENADDPDPAIIYSKKSGSHGKIVKISNYLKNFGYLNDSGVRLRKYPSLKSTNLGNYSKNTTFKILGKTSEVETIGNDTGVWYKVRLTDGKEGYFFGAFVSSFE